MHDYEKMGTLGEGTYGQVFCGKHKKDGTVVALKRVRMERESEGFPLTALREIVALKELHHPNIVKLIDVVVGRKRESVFMTFEYCEHDLAGLIDHMRDPFSIAEIKTLMNSILSAVAFMHDHSVLHRDLKMSNLLLSNKGVLNIADFGLSRNCVYPPGPYSPNVVTLWYRVGLSFTISLCVSRMCMIQVPRPRPFQAPELLLGCKRYGTALDMWSVGCIFAELLAHKPFAPGKTELEQISLVCGILGAPDEVDWPGLEQLKAHRIPDSTRRRHGGLRHFLRSGCKLCQGRGTCTVCDLRLSPSTMSLVEVRHPCSARCSNSDNFVGTTLL